MPAVGESFAQRYLLTALIGQRDTGGVYRAQDTVLDRAVAIKILSPTLAREGDFIRRFQHETTAASRLSHAHIVAYYDWGIEGGHPYVVTELCPGGSLRDMLDAGANLTLPQAAQLGLEVAEGLSYAHERGLIHGGIAPANILFDAAGRAKITDFALAILHADTALPSFHDRIFGPTFYAAPEEIESSELTAKADVYALALVLVEAVTGQYPFVGESTLSVLWERLVTPLPTPPSLLALADPMARAGAMDPQQRLTTEELAEELRKLTRELGEPEPLPLVGMDGAGGSDRRDGADGRDRIDGRNGAVVGAGDGARKAGALSTDSSSAAANAAADSADSATPPPTSRLRALTHRLLRADTLVSAAAVVVIAVLAIAGFAVFRADSNAAASIPNFIGQDWDAAVADIGNRWQVQRYEQRRNGVAVGEVLTQHPEPGTKLTSDEQITLTVSIGEELVTLPSNLIGLPTDVVALRLNDLGLSLGEVTRVQNLSIAAGTVLDIAEPLLDVPSGTAVDLIVSDGPGMLPVPQDLVGAQLAEVTAALTAAGFVLSQQAVYDAQAPDGTILLVTPDSGTVVEVGSELRLVISRGPRPVPDVKGLTLAEATAALESEGFCLDSQTLDGINLSSIAASAIVANSVPPAGETLSILVEDETDGTDETGDGGDTAGEPVQLCVTLLME